MILHIPHSNVAVPEWIKFDKDIAKDLERMTDWYTDELFTYSSMDRIVFPYTRLVCDVERLVENESMEAHGHGICYTKDSYGNHLKNVTTSERDYVIKTLYKPHHDSFNKACNHALTLFDKVVIVDCHSFSDVPLPHEENKLPRSDWCIGTDDFHTPTELVDDIVSLLNEQGYTVSINEPFSGTIVPLQHYNKTSELKSIMIEVNRKLYMDSTANFEKTKLVINNILDVINTYEKR